MTDDEQPYIDRWPMFEEAYSKFLVLADVAHAPKKGGHIKAVSSSTESGLRLTIPNGLRTSRDNSNSGKRKAPARTRAQGKVSYDVVDTQSRQRAQ